MYDKLFRILGAILLIIGTLFFAMSSSNGTSAQEMSTLQVMALQTLSLQSQNDYSSRNDFIDTLILCSNLFEFEEGCAYIMDYYPNSTALQDISETTELINKLSELKTIYQKKESNYYQLGLFFISLSILVTTMEIFSRSRN